jgi:cell division protease FtsH
MPVNKNPQPQRSRQIANIVLWAATGLLLLNIVFSSFGSQTAREPYSMFIHRIDEQEVVRASVGQNEIRYQVKDPVTGEPGEIYTTTPDF